MTHLLDTNVLSEIRKIEAGRADPRVTAWAKSIEPTDCYLSTMTIMEIERGVLLLERRDASQGAALRKWLNTVVLVEFSGRILPVDNNVALRAAALSVPNPLPLADCLIAATALEHNLILVTRNVGDFAQTPAHVLNPWAPPPIADV